MGVKLTLGYVRNAPISTLPAETVLFGSIWGERWPRGGNFLTTTAKYGSLNCWLVICVSTSMPDSQHP
jgi:hypothetical protein